MTDYKTKFESELEMRGLKLGCYNSNLDRILTKKAFNQVVDNLEFGYTDLFLRIRRKLYIVSIEPVDGEVDLGIKTGLEYFSQFDNLEEAYNYGEISEDEYKAYARKLGYQIY